MGNNGLILWFRSFDERKESSQKIVLGVMATLATGLLGVAVLLLGCDRSPSSIVAPEKIRFGMAQLSLSALPIIALEQGYFTTQGLELVVSDLGTGDATMSALLTGAVDMATCSEVPVVAACFQQTNFVVCACISATSHEHAIVARKDAGIATPADLRGKRVATLRNTAMHFFLHLALLYQHMSEQDVILSFLKAEDVVPALVRGEVDAMVMREPFTSQAMAQLGDKAIVFEFPEMYQRSQLIVGNKTFLQARPEAARRFIRSLLSAEQFAQQQPLLAQQIVAKCLGIEPPRLARDWPHLQLRVSLEQSLLSQLEDEASWMLADHLVPPATLPNLLRFIDAAPLRSAKPEASTLLQ